MDTSGSVALTIVFSLDPFGKAFGGLETFVRGLQREQ